MKVFFVCDWDYSLFWPKVAERMKETGFCSEFSALVVGELYYREVLSKDGLFEKVYLLQEGCEEERCYDDLQDRIERIEKKYSGDVLWRYVLADRSWIDLPYDSIRSRLVQCFEYFEDLYSKEAPDLIVTHGYSSMPHLVSYVVASKMGIKVFKHLSVRIEDRYILLDNEMEYIEWGDKCIEEDFEISDEGLRAAADYIGDFQALNKRPDYFKINRKNRVVTVGHIYRFFRYVYRYYFGVYRADHSKINPFLRLYKELMWRVRRGGFQKFFKWDCCDGAEEYVYFPLHMQPEASTMLLAPYYLDQLSVIESLSRSVPLNYRLVVKEHPSMIGRRGGGFYKKIKMLPNVILVDPSCDGLGLVSKSSLVFTITGTAGLEGMLLGKPVVVIGSPFYRHCPLVRDASNVAPPQWQYVIKEMLENFKSDRELLERFVAILFDKSFAGVFIEPLAAKEIVLSDDNVKTICDELIRAYEAGFA